MLSGVEPFYVLVYLASMAFPSLSSVVKEITFADSKTVGLGRAGRRSASLLKSAALLVSQSF